MEQIYFGQRIAALRKEKGMTQEALAQRLGITNQAVSKWESDQCCPDIMQLPALADIFEISMDALFGRQTPEKPQESSMRKCLMMTIFKLFCINLTVLRSSRKWITDCAAYAGCRTAEGLYFRRMIMRFIFEKQQPFFISFVCFHINFYGAGVDFFGFVKL